MTERSLASASTDVRAAVTDVLKVRRVFGSPTAMVPTNGGYTRVGSGRDANRPHHANRLGSQGGAAWMAGQQPQQVSPGVNQLGPVTSGA